MGEAMLGGTEVDVGQGNDSQPRQTADEYWFGRTSISEANDAPVNYSPSHVNPRSPPIMASFPSSGNLVCSSPAVPASMLRAELLPLHDQEPFAESGPLWFKKIIAVQTRPWGRNVTLLTFPPPWGW